MRRFLDFFGLGSIGRQGFLLGEVPGDLMRPRRPRMSDTTTTKRKPSRPKDLDKAGAKLWREIITSGKYELRPDEVRILEDACRQADLIDDLAEAAKDADKLVAGSMGQLVINPLIAELRQHRNTLASLLGKLKLPDEADESSGESPRSTSARKAAQSRWGTG